MDGYPVGEEPSEELETKTMTEVFSAVFPQYLVMGMSYDEFWRGPSILAKYCREAYKIRQHNEEWARWRQGAYIYDALLRVAPVMRAAFGKGHAEPGKYPDEPWPLTQKEADALEEKRARENYFKAIAQRKAESERRKQMRAEQAAIKEASENGRD